MQNKLIRLKVIGISYSQTQSGAYALILAEEKGERRIPIIIGGFEAQAIVIKLENLEPPRPLTHDLFRSFAMACGVTVEQVLINKLREGIFYSEIVCTDGERRFSIDSRTSDAVALALRFECPIFIEPQILNEAGIVMSDTAEEEDKKKAGEEAVKKSPAPPNEYGEFSVEELRGMLTEAVSREDYEQAAAIRDELTRRKEKE
ncbi:MAG: bifunctional nuclease family protein [Bacteroidales bacterium]|nr:bifunctional nuclease family protein [Bacteroidales bacterium]MDT8374369.1 bifunctional nuclease family protein [Bacteroidales bacterium]